MPRCAGTGPARFRRCGLGRLIRRVRVCACAFVRVCARVQNNPAMHNERCLNCGRLLESVRPSFAKSGTGLMVEQGTL